MQLGSQVDPANQDSNSEDNRNTSTSTSTSVPPLPSPLSTLLLQRHHQQQLQLQQQFLQTPSQLAQSFRRPSAGGETTASTSSFYSNSTEGDEDAYVHPSSILPGEASRRRASKSSSTSDHSFKSAGPRRPSLTSTPRARSRSRTNSAVGISPPTTPTLRGNSSRSKILASSAMVIEGAASPTYSYDHRSRSSSVGQNLIDTSIPQRQSSRSPNFLSPSSTSRLNLNAGTSDIIVEEVHGPEPEESKEVTSPKASLKSRIFGLRRAPKETQDQTPASDKATFLSLSPVNTIERGLSNDSDASIAANHMTSASSTTSFDSKMEKSISSRTLMERDRPSSSTSSSMAQSRSTLKEGNERIPVLSDGWAVADGPKDEFANSSWITSLISASPPPSVPAFDSGILDRPSLITPSTSSSDLVATPDDTSKLQRMGSWPPSDRSKGSFTSLKGNGTEKGYRLESAAPQTNASSPSFLRTDPSRSIDIPSEKSEKWKNVTKLGSPTALDSEGRKPHIFRSDSTGSNQSLQVRGSPKNNLHFLRPSTAEESNRRGHLSTLPSSTQNAAKDDNVYLPTKMKRSSGSHAGSFQSAGSQPSSPVLHMPRSSSIQSNRSSVQIRPTSSRHPSFISASSSIEMIEDLESPRSEAPSKPKKRPSSSRASLSGSNSSFDASGAAAIGSVAAMRSKSGDGKGRERELEGRVFKRTISGSSQHDMTKSTSEMSPLLDVLSKDESQEGIVPPDVPKKDRKLLRPSTASSVTEPKRPTKSPLRIASGSSSGQNVVRSNSLRKVSDRQSFSSTAPVPDPTSSTETEARARQQELENLLGRSLPRKSIEEVIQLESVTFAKPFGEDKSKIPMSSPSLDAIVKEELRVQSVPESAKRLGTVTRGTGEINTALSNDSTSHLTLDEEYSWEDGAQPGKANATLAQRYKTLRKVSPPGLANVFTKSAAKPSEDVKLETQIRSMSLIDKTPVKRTTKKWPFGRESGGGEAVVDTVKGRKITDPMTARPTITRVFDESRLGEGLGSDDSDDDDQEPVQVLSAAALAEGAKITYASTYMASSSTLVTPSDTSSLEAKLLNRRRNVIRELVETERSYASDLAVARDVYLARARAAVGLSSGISLQHTPRLDQGNPLQSPASIPSASSASHRASPLYTAHRNFHKTASSELALPPSSPAVPLHSTDSPSSFASSSAPSNRSSTYTVSSQTSQTSESSFPFQSGNPPPLPSTPPNLAGLPTTGSGITSQSMSASSNSSTSTFNGTARTPSGKPKMAISTTSLTPNGGVKLPSSGGGDVGLTLSDVRVIFAQLEACCAFAEEMSSLLASSMGTFARSRKMNASDVTPDIDKRDDRLGETFLHLMTRIRSVYNDYCSRHEAGMKRLQEVMAQSFRANIFFKECAEIARSQTNAWDLASLLIKPVQRVLKYPLLIEQIISSTSPSHEDYNNLVLAFNEIQAVADDINQVKKRRDLADELITGRSKEARGNNNTTGSIGKSKKKSFGKLKEDEGLIIPFGTEEGAIEDCETLIKQFIALYDNAPAFGHQCTKWSTSMREVYESQLSVMVTLSHIYHLRVEVETGTDGTVKYKESKEAIQEEAKLVMAYAALLRNILRKSWRQLDVDIRTTILAMTNQVQRMFEAPKMVIIKRDERQADYQRYRHSVLTGKQAERRVLENANGFIALNAQLVEELPVFLFGVQSLINSGIELFTRLQAEFFDQVRVQTFEYWIKVAKRGDEIVISADTGLPSLGHINYVRCFWDRHSISAGWVESLSILRRTSKSAIPLANEYNRNEHNPTMSTANLLDVSLANTLQLPPSEMKTGSTLFVPGAANAENPSPSPSLSRRPSGVANLMRSLSGTFGRENISSGGEVPALPSDAAAQASPATSQMPPSLPSLKFKTGRGGESYFVQAAPIPFLDKVEKEPYEDSPDSVTPSLPSVTSSEGKSSNELARMRFATEAGRSPLEGPKKTTNRQRLKTLYQCTATTDSPRTRQQPQQTFLGWPYAHFVKGDTIKVLSSDNSTATPLYFGRIDRSGEVGWVEKKYF